jgi:aspartyl-tRNA(Asn)/glutamyl-tRNA(Gln) amidotransferase subunit A
LSIDSSPISRRQFGLLLAAGAVPLPLSAAPDPAALTLTEVSAHIRSGSLTSTQLVEACLARIDVYNPKINAFISVIKRQALAQAAALDADSKARRWRGPLHGIPIALKDNIDTAGIRTTAGSAVYDDRVPRDNAEVVSRLLAAGAVLIGKTNLHEFAFGGTSATSYFGPVRNPWALDYTSGGSSGGSAAALAAGLCLGALGTDTGGSIRTPASYCGVVGLKPTYGLVSIRGIIPLAVSLDHCGPMCRTVEDTALLLNILAGYDAQDLTSIEHRREDYVAAMQQPVQGFRIGIPRAPFFDMLDPDIARAVEEALGVIGKLTAEQTDVTLPATSDLNDDAIIAAEELAFHEEQFKRSPGRYMIQERRLLAAAQGTTAAEYIRSRWRLGALRRSVDESFREIDLVVLPTRRHTPRTLESALQREESEKLTNPEQDNTPAFNAYGIPAISLPCGFTGNGIPVGLMIAGPRWSEGKVLALARAYQNATDWHKRQPPLRPDTPVPKLSVLDDRFK